MKIKVLAIILVFFSGLSAQEIPTPEEVKSDPAEGTEIVQEDPVNPETNIEGTGDPSDTSVFYDRTYADPLKADHQFGFSVSEEAGLFSFPQPDNTFTWGADIFYRMRLILVSNDMSLTAEPYYCFAAGGIPGTPEQNAFSLYRLYGSLFFSDDTALQVGFLNAEQGIIDSAFNPFAWNKKSELFRSLQDQEPWLGVSVKTPIVRAFYVYNPDLSLSAGSFSANIFPNDLISGGLIIERLSGNTNRAGGYLVSRWTQDFTLEADYAAACYFNDSFSDLALEMNGRATFIFEGIYAQAGLYWNGRRDALGLADSSSDPYGYLNGPLYAYGNIDYTNKQFTVGLSGIGNLDDGSISATPSFTFRTFLVQDFDLKIIAEFPLVFGEPGDELYDLIPTSYCAVLKIEASYALSEF